MTTPEEADRLADEMWEKWGGIHSLNDDAIAALRSLAQQVRELQARYPGDRYESAIAADLKAEALAERLAAVEKVNAVLADQLAAWHDMKPDVHKMLAAKKVVESARSLNYLAQEPNLAQALREYDEGMKR